MMAKIYKTNTNLKNTDIAILTGGEQIFNIKSIFRDINCYYTMIKNEIQQDFLIVLYLYAHDKTISI